jgi:nucleoside-diphosphate-sugar epimerase
MRKKTILLTGVAGFIGSKTAECLLSADYRVVGVDNLNDYYDPRLKNYHLKSLKNNPNFHFLKIDIEDKEKLESLFEKENFLAVINLAARAGVRYSIENPKIYFTTNVLGSLNLLELMKKFRVGKYILASTSSLYAGQKMPFSEELPVNEPISPYAASKKAAEALAFTYHHLFDIDVSILRYFTVYGPAGRPDMSVFRFIKWVDEKKPIELFGDGEQSRDFTFVDDIARGTVAALEPLGFEIINLGGGKKPVKINRMIKLIEKYLDKKANIKHLPVNKADMEATSADIQKAKRLLNWQPEVNFDKGIKGTVDWYLENKKWLREIKI